MLAILTFKAMLAVLVSMQVVQMQEDLEQDKQRASDASKGGAARAKKLSPEERKEIAKKAAQARWAMKKKQASARSENADSGGIPEGLKQASAREDEVPSTRPRAILSGSLALMGRGIPCYVLDDGRRVIGRTAANEALTGIDRYGDFEKTIGVRSLRPFLDFEKITSQFVAFDVEDVEQFSNDVKGMPADVFIDVCRGFVTALEASYRYLEGADYPPMTDRQKEIAVQASMFLAAVAKVGLDALIDEATGFQEVREKDALEIKLRAYLADEMRKWEKTFPDELWMEFGRLTNWKGTIHKRPKYWGKLVMELIYEYLDPDVAQWLRENAPHPRGGQNYHQWLSSQYGLQKLVQHIWQVIGMAKACSDISELKRRMSETFGNDPIQLTIKLPKTPK